MNPLLESLGRVRVEENLRGGSNPNALLPRTLRRLQKLRWVRAIREFIDIFQDDPPDTGTHLGSG